MTAEYCRYHYSLNCPTCKEQAMAEELSDLRTENRKLRKALEEYKRFSKEAWGKLDADQDHKCLKLLMAMSGELPGYRADIDEVLKTK